MRPFFACLALCAAFSASAVARAEVISVTPEDQTEEEKSTRSAEIARVYFLADVSPNRIADLVGVLDNLNTNYKSLRKIYLYINSEGGDLDSGKIAYWAIKSSRTPVATVNLSKVASAATVIFCGAQERLSLDGGTFLLHAPKTWVEGAGYLPSDELSNSQRYLEAYKNMLAGIYKDCTNIAEEEVRGLLESEDDSLLLSSSQAKAKGLVTDVADRVVDAPLSIFITGEDESG